MTDKQRKFCDEYLVDFNATRAYKAAYPSCNKDETANVNGSKLLRNAKVTEYIEKRKKELNNKLEITQERVLQEMARVAFGDIRKLYNENGSLKNIQDIDDDTAAIITGIETTEEFDGYGEDREQIGYTKKVKMADKVRALDMLGKYFGMFKEKVEHSQDKPFEVNINIKKKE